MKRVLAVCFAAVSACAAWGGGAEGVPSVAPRESGVSRNAFIEVTPPPGRGVRWVSEDDFTLTGRPRAGAGSVVVRARPGWRLTRPRDGVMSLSPGQRAAYAVQGDLGEDGGGGDGHECDSREEVVTNCTPARLSMGSLTAKAGGILLPPEVTSVPVSLGAGVSVDSEGQHEIVTTVIPCTVCGEPPAGVTRSTVTTTPTQFLWEWSAGPTNGSEVGGAAFSKSVDIGSPARHPVSFSATATNVPPCCACSASAATNALVMRIETETVAEFPEPRTRKTLGVGEFVKLTLAPSAESGEWRWKDPAGQQQMVSGSALDFEAPYAETESPSTVIFNHLSSGLSALIHFVITEPSVYLPSVYLNQKLGQGIAGVSAEIKLIFPPDNVSYYRVLKMEIGMVATDATGWFLSNPDKWAHNKEAGADMPRPLALANLETTVKDYVGMLTPRSWWARLHSRPWEAGVMTWPIPAVWWVEGDTKTNSLPWSDQRFSLTSDGTVTIEKFGLAISRGTNDVCVPYP